MPKIIPDLTGQRFVRLFVRRFVGSNEKKFKCYEVLCDCGTLKVVAGCKLYSGEMQSCGCLLAEARKRNIQKAIEQQTKHGMSGSPTYINWAAMMARCYNRKHTNYSRYGKLGVGVCQFLRMEATSIVKIIGERPKPHYSIDRIDAKGQYACGKCEECEARKWPLNIRWATPTEQAHNRRNNVWITIDGVRKTCYDWSKHFGRSYHWVRDHYKADEPTPRNETPSGSSA